MRYWLIPFILIVELYPLSYAKYNWDKNNRLGAAGAALIAVAAVVFPTVMIILGEG